LDTQCLSFRDVPGASRLFLDFLAGNPQLQPFYPHLKLSIDELVGQARNIKMPADRRQHVADLLSRQNRGWNAASQSLENIQKLRAGACAVVSGQQVGLFLGPAYTLYKAVTAICLAREFNSRGVDAVPIFWLASEDHDLAEVNHALVPDGQGGLKRLETSSAGGTSAPVGTVKLGDDLSVLVEELGKLIGDSEALDFVRQSYRPGQTLAGAFAELLVKVFSPHGLIVLEPADPEIHRIAAPLFQSAAKNSDLLTQDLLHRNKELEAAGYHAQVKVTSSSTPLFFLKDGARVPLHKKNGDFAFNGQHWSTEQLEAQIEQTPELFTANVLLRPVLQDYLLPTAVYIGGPAEIAYFAQVQVVYERLSERVTPVCPRFSTTLLEGRLASWMRKYGLRLQDVLHPKDEFLSLLSRRTIPPDIKDDFQHSREQLESLLSTLLQSLNKLDPTVGAAGDVAASKMRYQLEHLEARAARTHLQREQVLERHATLLSSMLFPERELQEREIAGIYFVGKYGTGLIEKLLEAYRPECHDHQVIELM
jgi:bacillithiol synthase